MSRAYYSPDRPGPRLHGFEYLLTIFVIPTLAFDQTSAVWRSPLASTPSATGAKPKAFLAAPFNEIQGQVSNGRNRFAAAPDGQKFLVDSVDTSEQPQIAMLINWSRPAAR